MKGGAGHVSKMLHLQKHLRRKGAILGSRRNNRHLRGVLSSVLGEDSEGSTGIPGQTKGEARAKVLKARILMRGAIGGTIKLRAGTGIRVIENLQRILPSNNKSSNTGIVLSGKTFSRMQIGETSVLGSL